jgi:hypothetical protein
MWIRRVAAANANGDFDGVMIDNVLGLVSGWSGKRYPTLYPNDAAWERAMTRFVRAVGPVLQKRRSRAARTTARPTLPSGGSWRRTLTG